MSEKRKKIKRTVENIKNEDKIKEVDKDKRRMFVITCISIITGVLGLIIAGIAVVTQWYSDNRDYEYNLDPKVEMTSGIAVKAQVVNGEKVVERGINNVGFEILESNNLDKAYLINSDYSITKIDISDKDGTPSESIPFGEPDLTVNDINYYYKFVLLEGLDDSYTLTLVYSKNTMNDEVLKSNALTDIEVLELEKYHQDDPDYEGERILAKKYNEMKEYCKKYLE